MTTERSTYTYEGGEEETVALSRGPASPPGHAALRINYSDGSGADCFVNTAWLRDRLNDLGEPCRLTPDAITDEMVLRFWNAFNGLNDGLEDMTLMSIDEVRTGLSAALTEPPARPEGAEKVEAVLHQYWSGDIDGDDLADRIAEEMNR